MPRNARIVCPGTPHHVTQRGNRRMQTFFLPEDYSRYVELVAEGCAAANVGVLAWCLMPNHVHMILVPSAENGLTKALSWAHQRYTWVVNRRNGWQGHLWQQRFYSCPLDEPHTLAAIRYVELNPVRAYMVSAPALWPWSSTRGRISGAGDKLVPAGRPEGWVDFGSWHDFLAEGLTDEDAERIRRYQTRGLPLGDEAFIAAIERRAGRSMRPLPRGRPPIAEVKHAGA